MGSRLKTKQKMLISFSFFVRKTKSLVPNSMSDPGQKKVGDPWQQ
jgi:hypothetical protein